MIKNSVWRKREENFSMNSFFWPFAQSREKAGKIAVAKDAPKIPIGNPWRLLEKLKIAIEPAVIIEAMAVITIRLIWLAAIPKTLGIIKVKILFIAGYLKPKRNLCLKPQFIAEGIWMDRCKKAPKITPNPTPKIPKQGDKNKIPNIMPKLYKIGANE